ncbi:MAG TPA: hypothetical protein VHA06_23920 [Candidatus Angelobacter sp.]|jgi:hypothetical protein|nr:hypothetical protein [Candidatus Angelobacter sp.]
MSPQQGLVRWQQPQLEWSPQDSGPRHKTGRKSGKLFFQAGQTVPESGIYQVIHHEEHRPSHEAVMHRGDPFPSCDQCHEQVRFQVLHIAPYIFDDEDFAEE